MTTSPSPTPVPVVSKESIRSIMDSPLAVFTPERTVAQVVADLRELVKEKFVTYIFVVDAETRLKGLVTMRDLLFSETTATLEAIMLRDPFFLSPDLDRMEAMREVLDRHFPVYPVCEPDGRLVGLIRGQDLFEAQAIELSAQAGSMVGVEKEERLATPWIGSLKSRHPWLQLNLLTAFVAAFVVGIFEGTIEQIVVLAVFLPVLAGQSGNTGCQALAVTLRGMTLGDLKKGAEKKMIIKEALLGLCNGALVGVTAGLGMIVYASLQGTESAFVLGLVTFLAMTSACVVSGVCGVLVPVTLKKLGADPATASSIFLTTFTDVASMGLFLGLATIILI